MHSPIVHIVKDYTLILLGSFLYALSTVLFIFPHSLLLGGTSGISVILEAFLPFSPGAILMVINFTLIFLAFSLLGREMAVRTLIGSTATTTFIWYLESLLALETVPVVDPICSAILGAGIIALASGVLFYVNSSSGGTDILALIVRKFTHMNIGKSLLATDVLIVIIGGLLRGKIIFAASFLGLSIKTLGIDLVIALIRRVQSKLP